MEDCGDRIELARRTAPGLFSFDYVLPGEDVFKDFQFHHHEYALPGEEFQCHHYDNVLPGGDFFEDFQFHHHDFVLPGEDFLRIFLSIFNFTTMTMSCLVRIVLRIFNVLPGEDL